MGTPARPLDVLSDAERAAVLLEPNRLRLVGALRERPDSAVGLAKRLGLPRQRVNYHLRTLEGAGLVELVETRRKRNCVERIVRARASTFLVDPAALGEVGAGEAEQTKELSEAAEGGRFSAAYLVALAARTIRELAVLMRAARKEGKRLATLSVDTTLRFKSPEDQAAFGEELARAIADLTAKYHDGTAENGRAFRVTAFTYQQITKEIEG